MTMQEQESPELEYALTALVEAVITDPGNAMGSFREWCQGHQDEIKTIAHRDAGSVLVAMREEIRTDNANATKGAHSE
jgi:hypothetical protein